MIELFINLYLFLTFFFVFFIFPFDYKDHLKETVGLWIDILELDFHSVSSESEFTEKK